MRPPKNSTSLCFPLSNNPKALPTVTGKVVENWILGGYPPVLYWETETKGRLQFVPHSGGTVTYVSY